MKKLVYIIEDDIDVLSMMTSFYTRNGFEIYADWNGSTLTSESRSGPVPDLYMIDVNLFGRNGMDLCRLLKEQYPAIPVMLISANHDYSEKALESGADAFIEKPFDLPALLAVVNKLIL